MDKKLKKLIAYIKNEELQGYSAQQLKKVLVSRGWDQEEVNKALEEASGEMLELLAGKSEPKVNALLIFGICFAVSIIAVGIGLYYASPDFFGVTEVKEPAQEPPQVIAEQVPEPIGCNLFPAKLEACEPYECGETRITGITGEKCGFIKNIPNGQMVCSFTEEMRIKVARYYESGQTGMLQEALDTGACVT